VQSILSASLALEAALRRSLILQLSAAGDLRYALPHNIPAKK
jgi:hypothetical protein